MIRVFIADDHAVVRDGLRAVLSATSDLVVVGDAATGEEVLRRAPVEAWDVLVLDLQLADMSGLTVLRRLRPLVPRLGVLVLSMHPEDQYAVHVLQAGASGFLNKGRPAAVLLEAVRTIGAGRRYVTPDLAALLLSSAGPHDEPHHALTPRELEILIHVGRGMSTSLIAKTLDLSATTVSTHLARIREKLGLETTGQLAQYALRAGLVQ